MSLSRILELVGQAEKEGVTLAAVLSRDLSLEEMELMQKELASHLSDNYSKIEGFMADVEVPSMEEILARSCQEVPELDFGKLDVSSDGDEIETENP